MDNTLSEKTNDQSFENAILELEKIVKALEEGNENLDDTLKLYEKGIRLYRYCNNKIENAEQKISIIQNNIEIPFSNDPREED